MIQKICSFDFPFDPSLGWMLAATFGFPGTVPGRFGGRALAFRNTGFGDQNLSQALDVHNRHYFGFAYCQVPNVGGTTWAGDVEIIRMSSGGSRLLTLRTTADRKLQLLTTNSLISQGFTRDLGLNQWWYIEIVYNVSGTVELWINDVLEIAGAALDPQFPTQLTLRWQNFADLGPNFDDFVLGDESGLTNTTRIGPVKIRGWYCDTDDAVQWTPHGSTTNSGAVRERYPTNPSPDGDTTYVFANSAGLTDLYNLHPDDSCTNKILAVVTNTVAKSQNGDAGGLFGVVVRPDPTVAETRDVAGFITSNAAYQLVQRFSLLSPRTGEAWTDGGIEAALWGLRSVSGVTRVTAFWVDKVQTLRSLPFDCGRTGSYVIMK